MNRKLKLVVVDADVIINLFKLGLWEKTINHYTVYIAETVLTKEVFFYEIFDGSKLQTKYIDFAPHISSGKIQVLSVNAAAMAPLFVQMTKLKAPLIDAGELETIASLFIELINELNVCLIDEAAIKCAVIVGLRDKCFSFEELVYPFSLSSNLEPKLLHRRFTRIVSEAEVHRIHHLLI